MLIFSKDISDRDFKHPREKEDADLKEYMEYQRKLYPYTVVRSGLDLAYKELDDILNYIENGEQRTEDSQREEYPEDVGGWYKNRFPWSASFLEMQDMHSVLVYLIKAMDSFRTFEKVNTYHLAVLYDSVHNIIEVYNELLETNFNAARDIRLSNNTRVHFDDFINNYWPHLEFMILSKPDYPHQVLQPRISKIEKFIKEAIESGISPLEALESAANSFKFDEGTLPLLRRDPLLPELAQLESLSLNQNPYEPPLCDITTIQSQYEKSFDAFKEFASKKE